MTIFTHRFLARIIMEAATPLAVGNGERNVITDQLIITDVNGLPYIPGTALAGVVRNSLGTQIGKSSVDKLMGFQGDGNDGQGSRLIHSHAQMIGVDGLPIEGIVNIDRNVVFYKHFQNLPVRQHVRMSHKGAAEDKGKFDEQVVYKGTRFCFEIELVSDGTDTDVWENILETFNSPLFRMGRGTRKGFGELTVCNCKSSILNLKVETDLNMYLDKTSSLNDNFWSSIVDTRKTVDSDEWINYKLNILPDNFYLFSSGLENADAKMIPVTEKIIEWSEDGKPEFTNEQILIPASSVKGALAHRVAFHYNKLMGNTAEHILQLAENEKTTFELKAKEFTGENNPAVRTLFGYSAKGDDGQRGNVILSDIFKGEFSLEKKKLLNHVAIDRFTGGAMDGALFNEEVIYKDGNSLTLAIKVLKEIKDNDINKAFNLALSDITTGMLPLGGGTMRGHGSFKGEILINGKELKK